ncbi:ABC transporter permease [Devosia sp. Root436]|jgi:iron complex transport system permease protein|uniref:FecCD family ABC transporter permease n=1 Tax=Devosia sp. Root436 TaxID=1736537 RepID=UPI0006FE4889|nr:iron ABC transporter permease [Devosia sp. Root436]KQX40474.1 ABC transporter permease [Devosia sp. Root436]
MTEIGLPRSTTSRAVTLIVALVVLVIAAALWGISVGAVAIPVDVIVNTLFNLDGEQQTYIIIKSRLPRMVLALLAGGALALSGAIIQAVIRNPLASPNIIGINSGAALFALGMVLVFPAIPVAWMPLAACIGGLLAASFVMLVAHYRNLSAVHLALIGVAVGFVFQAGVDYLLITSSDSESSAPMIWLTGSLWGRTWGHVAISWIPLLALSAVALLLSYRLDLIALGEGTATGLGLNVPRQRLILLFVATMLASVAVAVVGVMGFIGLMAPHIARRLVGGSHRLMLPVSALVGMLLVVLADSIGRAIAPPIEISAGILAALIGAPFFVYIMLTTASET